MPRPFSGSAAFTCVRRWLAPPASRAPIWAGGWTPSWRGGRCCSPVSALPCKIPLIGLLLATLAAPLPPLRLEIQCHQSGRCTRLATELLHRFSPECVPRTTRQTGAYRRGTGNAMTQFKRQRPQTSRSDTIEETEACAPFADILIVSRGHPQLPGPVSLTAAWAICRAPQTIAGLAPDGSKGVPRPQANGTGCASALCCPDAGWKDARRQL